MGLFFNATHVTLGAIHLIVRACRIDAAVHFYQNRRGSGTFGYLEGFNKSMFTFGIHTRIAGHFYGSSSIRVQ